MRFLSVCSGIEAASVAWTPLGWKAVAFSEIEPFPCAVLSHHYPDVPNLGDMTSIRSRVESGEVEAPDLLCGGTPCQAFSVAGLRQSLSDERGNLSLEFIRIADAIDRVRCTAGKQPAWVVWENVPGVLSTHDNAFGAFVGGLCGGDSAIPAPAAGWPRAGVVAGPSRVVAWRVLDAQYFGLAQRRQRVFVLALGGAGKWACADALLPVSDRMQWHPAPSREAGQRTAATLDARTDGGGFPGTDGACGGHVVPVAGTLQAGGKAAGSATQQDAESGLLIAHSLRGEGFDASEDGTGRGTPLVPVNFQASQSGMRLNDTVGTLDANYGSRRHNGVAVPVAFAATDYESGAFDSVDAAGPLTTSANLAAAMGTRGSATTASGPQVLAQAVALRGREGGGTAELGDDAAHALRASSGGGDKPHVLAAMQVRRLTPEECEALQGFPRGYTAIPWRGKPASECPDGPRYKALGNSWAVPVARWIGRRIELTASMKEAA